ncbi:MAG: methyltransferase [Nitrospirales bacterium]|nr:MAG: methyltransferase [Nitrospirales bacterium]
MTYQDLMQFANGYADSKVLLVANELGVFTALGKTKRTSDEMARACRSDREGMRLLLNALTGLELVHQQAGKYWSTTLARKFLDAHSPTAITNLLWLLNHHWANWTDMAQVIKKGRQGWAPITKSPDFRRRLALAMEERSLILAPPTIRTCRMPHGATTFFDLAGGSGAYAIALAQRYPTLTGVIIDQSVSVAKRLIMQRKLEHRLSVRRGDVFTVPLPHDSDVALVANIFHDFNVQENRTLLRRIREALRPGGKVFIVEFFLDDTGTKPADAAVFSLLMYAFTDTGRSYGWTEVEEWLKAEGFGRLRRHPISGSIGTLEATRL